MAVLLPVLYLALSMGITFDLPSYREGNVLVYGDPSAKTQFDEVDEFLSLYKVINSPKDVREFVRVDPRVAIQTKLDNFDTIISSIIRSSVTSRETIVEIMVGSRYIRAIETFPSDMKTLDSWKTKKPSEVGTHYVKSLFRGAYFLTSIIFPCESAEQKEKVLKAVNNHLKDSGKFDNDFIEKMNKIKEELGNDYVNYRFGAMNCMGCTFPFINNLEQVVKIATELPKTVKSSGTGYGYKLIMELEELSKISDFPAYQENSDVIEKLDEIDQLFDDVIIARKELIRTEFLWSSDLSDEQEKEVQEFYKKIERCRREFLHALVNLNISPSASVKQFDEIYKTYGSNEDYVKYQKQFRVLRDKIQKDTPKHMI